MLNRVWSIGFSALLHSHLNCSLGEVSLLKTFRGSHRWHRGKGSDCGYPVEMGMKRARRSQLGTRTSQDHKHFAHAPAAPAAAAAASIMLLLLLLLRTQRLVGMR